jgi:uncharacterized membrane protein
MDDDITQPGAKPMPPAPRPAPPESGAPSGPGKREPRTLAAGQGAAWWSEGWQVFMAAPGTWILIAVVLFLILIALAFVPVVGSLAQSVLAPVFGGGVALACHALAKGRPISVGNLFDGFSGQRFMPLFIIGLIYLAAMFVIWLGFIVAILGVAGGAGLFSAISADPSQMMSALFRSIGATALVLVPLALVATALVAMAYWFAPLLVVLNGEEPIDALRKSFHACWINLGATSIYGLILIGLCIVAAIPLGLGFIVLAPVMAGSWYASWRETFDA